MRCMSCNAELLEGQVECLSCGHKVETNKPLKENIKMSTKALSSKGEMSVGGSDILYSYINGYNRTSFYKVTIRI